MAVVEGFILDEDRALKEKLEGNPNFYVTNYADGSQKPIVVFFRSPDAEIRTRTFPHVSIDLVDIEPDAERTMRANAPVVPFPTETATPPSGFNLVSYDWPLPWTLIYQISAISRNPQWDRQMAQLFYMMFPNQYGSLDMSNFDGTVRRADLLGSFRRDLPSDDSNKRIYRQIFTIGVSSQFYLGQIQTIQQAVTPQIQLVEIGYGPTT